MSYLLAGFVAASAVTLAIRRRIEQGRTYQVEAIAERGEGQAQASLEMGWGTTTASRGRGVTTLTMPPIFCLWSKVSASAERGSEWSAANPMRLEWGRYPMCCTPCQRGVCEATASLSHEHHAQIPTKWDMSLAQYCSQLKGHNNSPVRGTLVVSGEFHCKIGEEELPEAVDFDWDVPPSDDPLGSPISRSPCVAPTPLSVGRSTPLGSHEGRPAPLRLSCATKQAAIISPLRTLPTRPPAPFRTRASADRTEVTAISWGAATAACHRSPSVAHCASFPFCWHKVAVTAGRGWSMQEASLELQWGKWGCGLAERSDEASAQLAHTWHSTTPGHHSLDREPATATATAPYCPPSIPKVFEPVTPERMGVCGDMYDDALPEAFEWEEGDNKDSHTSQTTPLSPLATRHTNRVKTPTTPVTGTRLDSISIPREGRLTPIRIGSTNRVVLSPNGDGVPRTIPPPLSPPPQTLTGTNRTKSPTSAEKGQAHLPTSLPSALLPRHTPLSPVRQPKLKTNRIPTPTRTMA